MASHGPRCLRPALRRPAPQPGARVYTHGVRRSHLDSGSGRQRAQGKAAGWGCPGPQGGHHHRLEPPHCSCPAFWLRKPPSPGPETAAPSSPQRVLSQPAQTAALATALAQGPTGRSSASRGLWGSPRPGWAQEALEAFFCDNSYFFPAVGFCAPWPRTSLASRLCRPMVMWLKDGRWLCFGQRAHAFQPTQRTPLS